jgi:hypothetical protein
MATNNAINSPPMLLIDTGFASWGGAGAYFDDTTLGSFTISRSGTGYIKGAPIAWTAPQTVSGLTAGNTYFIYIDDTGTIGATDTFSESLFENYIVLFECLRDSTTPANNQITVKENHPYDFPFSSSVFLHNVVGTVIENNLNGANIALNGTQKIQINGDDIFSDHGLETDIPDSAGVAVSWRQMFTNAGGKWCTYTTSDTFAGHYNNAGTVTALSANRFGVYTLYCSKDSLNVTTPFYFAVLNTAQYNSLSAANTAIANGSIAASSNELSGLEVAQLGYIIYSQASSSIVQVTISKATLKQTLSTSGTNTAALVNTSTTNFDGMLSSADTTVQAALDTIDDFGKWTEVTGISASLVKDQGFVANNIALVTLTLPATAVFGDVFRIANKGVGLVTIAQNASQTIYWCDTNTTTGVGGSLTATERYSALEILCITANNDFQVRQAIGNWTIV